jgi:protein TonB
MYSCKGKNSPGEVIVKENITLRDDTPPQQPLPFNIINGDTVWFRVDKFPVFPGGKEALSNYIGSTFVYPETARKKKIQGRVVVGFILTKECNITDVKIITGIDPDCDKEALRVVKSLPMFEQPASVNGRPVSFHFTLPVHYTLQ